RRADQPDQLAEPRRPVAPYGGDLPAHEQRVRRAPERSQWQPIRHPVLDPGPAALLQEAVAMLPARVGPAHLDVDESVGRIPLADERAPLHRHTEPGQPEIEHRAGRERVGSGDDLEPERRRREQDEVLGGAGIWGSMQFTYLAIYNTTAGNAVILQAATPVIVVLIARFYLGERLLRIQWLGVVASVLGVLLVITRGPFAMLEPADLHSGDFITLVSLGCWAVYTVYG